MRCLRWLFLICLLASMGPAFAQDITVDQLAKEAAQQADVKPVTPTQATISSDASPDAQRMYLDLRLEQERNKLTEVMLLCGLTLVSLVIVLFYISRTPGYTSNHMVNATGLIFIISGTIILVIMADTEQQLTAAMGILGAVAGYLFGTMRKGSEGHEGIEGKSPNA